MPYIINREDVLKEFKTLQDEDISKLLSRLVYRDKREVGDNPQHFIFNNILKIKQERDVLNANKSETLFNTMMQGAA
jgi:hypothetical protein